MTLQLLHRLAAQVPPIAITGADEVEAIHVLMLAGHLDATLAPHAGRLASARSSAATVHGLTRLGRWVLQHSTPPPRGG